MNTKIPFALIKYWTKMINRGDVAQALAWAESYYAGAPELVTAIYRFAEQKREAGQINQSERVSYVMPSHECWKRLYPEVSREMRGQQRR